MNISENTVGTLRAEAHHPPIACFSQSAQYGQYSTDKPLLRASGGDIGGGSEALIVNEKPKSKYIVRRLTPLECSRLQGFPDGWGVPDRKETLTDEEAAFWENVRKTHAEVNGKTYKPLKREALLKWYNGLHTDSAEYKMWGNGIALPNAYNVLKGCAEELMEEQK